jgi:ATP-dependent helicase HrpB
VVEFDDATRTVRTVTRERLGALVLAERAQHDPDRTAVAAAIAAAVRRAGIAALPWSEGARRIRERLAFVHHHDASWPDVSDAALLGALSEWFLPSLAQARRWTDVERLDLGALLLDRIGWERRAALDELAPTHITVPSGSRIPVDYADPATPALAVRLQEMFGATDTPRVARGRVAVTLHLLSPASRPVQVTRDLAGFWAGTYFEVRKDLRGRYPRHYWPDDPLVAEPTRRVKPH